MFEYPLRSVLRGGPCHPRDISSRAQTKSPGTAGRVGLSPPLAGLVSQGRGRSIWSASHRQGVSPRSLSASRGYIAPACSHVVYIVKARSSRRVGTADRSPFSIRRTRAAIRSRRVVASGASGGRLRAFWGSGWPQGDRFAHPRARPGRRRRPRCRRTTGPRHYAASGRQCRASWSQPRAASTRRASLGDGDERPAAPARRDGTGIRADMPVAAHWQRNAAARTLAMVQPRPR